MAPQTAAAGKRAAARLYDLRAGRSAARGGSNSGAVRARLGEPSAPPVARWLSTHG